MTNEELAALLTKLDGEATPGPWRWDKFASAGGAPVIVGPHWGGRKSERTVCKVMFDPGSEDPQVHDNARLIATYRNHHAQLVAGLAALGEVERLTRALQAIDRHNDNPRHYDSYVNDLIQAALQPAKEPTP